MASLTWRRSLRNRTSACGVRPGQFLYRNLQRAAPVATVEQDRFGRRQARVPGGRSCAAPSPCSARCVAVIAAVIISSITTITLTFAFAKPSLNILQTSDLQPKPLSRPDRPKQTQEERRKVLLAGAPKRTESVVVKMMSIEDVSRKSTARRHGHTMLVPKRAPRGTTLREVRQVPFARAFISTFRSPFLLCHPRCKSRLSSGRRSARSRRQWPRLLKQLPSPKFTAGCSRARERRRTPSVRPTLRRQAATSHLSGRLPT